jgi:hypothetical protein
MIKLAAVLAAHSVCSLPAFGVLPLPLGERVGGRGSEGIDRPKPLTPPLSLWEREQTELAALASAKSHAFIGQNGILIGSNAAASFAKQRIGSPPGICYDSGSYLL